MHVDRRLQQLFVGQLRHTEAAVLVELAQEQDGLGGRQPVGQLDLRGETTQLGGEPQRYLRSDQQPWRGSCPEQAVEEDREFLVVEPAVVLKPVLQVVHQDDEELVPHCGEQLTDLVL